MQCIIIRLRLGHSKLTHSYIMTKTPVNRCPKCGTTISIFHILIECKDYQCDRSGLPNNMKNCLDNVDSVYKVMNFLKQIGVLKSI